MKKIKTYLTLIILLILTGCASTAKCDAYGNNDIHPQNLERNDS